MRKIRQCEYCGDDLGAWADKYPGDVVVCGKPECQRYERDVYAQQRQDADEQLDDDMGYYG